MTKSIRVISADCETTALSAHEGWAWAIGFAWADYANGKLLDIIQSKVIYIPIPKAYWNAETFKFCMQHDPLTINKLMVAAHELNIKDPHTIMLHNAISVAQEIKDLVKTTIAGLAHREYIVVTNHPDFDIPFIERAFPGIKDEKQGGFYYRAIKDMQSLLEGHLGIQGCKDYLDSRKKAFGEPKHTALEDAVAQLKTLVMSGAIKP